jgi:hypothetical protein
MVTGFETVELAAGVQMVTDGFVGFSAQGAAKAKVAASKIASSAIKPRSAKAERVMYFPQSRFGPLTNMQGTHQSAVKRDAV